jgi:predicted small secreted protein
MYRSIARQLAVSVPLGWSVTELGEQLEIESDTEDVSVIVSTFSQTSHAPVDVVTQLQRFIDKAAVQGKAEIKKLSDRKASAEYVDGANWYVVVEGQASRFLLATCNTGVGVGRQNFRIGRDVVDSVTLFEIEELPALVK